MNSTDLAIIRARAKKLREKKKKEKEELQKQFDRLTEAIEEIESYSSPERIREMQKELDVVMRKIKALKEEIRKTDEQIANDITESETLQGKPGKDGKRGEKGEPGRTPVKGKDYFTPTDIALVTELSTPKKGKDYLTEKELENIKKEVTPKKGKDYKDGKDGKDGNEIKPTEVRDKLASLKGRARLDAKHIKNINEQIDFSIVGGGGASGTTTIDDLITISATEPSSPSTNDLWIDTSS